MRPDFDRIRRQQQSLNGQMGHTAMLRSYASASAASPAYGYGDEPRFLSTTITGLFAPATPEEVNAGGGFFVAGDVMATLGIKPDAQSEIVWQGIAYRIASDPVPLALMDNKAWRVLLRRGGATG